MSILIASDLHIGSSKSRYNDFLQILKSRTDIDKVIIAGDLLDLWVANVGVVLDRACILLDYLFKKFDNNFIWLIGNHDADVSHAESIIPNINHEFSIDINGINAYIIHGHQIDNNFYLKHTQPLPKLIAKCVEYIDRKFAIDVRKYLVSLSDKITNDPYDRLLLDFETNANIVANKTDSGIIIAGHTHMPAFRRLSNCYYINCGDWIQHRTYIIIDNTHIKLMSFKNAIMSMSIDDMLRDLNGNYKT